MSQVDNAPDGRTMAPQHRNSVEEEIDRRLREFRDAIEAAPLPARLTETVARLRTADNPSRDPGKHVQPDANGPDGDWDA